MLLRQSGSPHTRWGITRWERGEGPGYMRAIARVHARCAKPVHAEARGTSRIDRAAKENSGELTVNCCTGREREVPRDDAIIASYFTVSAYNSQ